MEYTNWLITEIGLENVLNIIFGIVGVKTMDNMAMGELDKQIELAFNKDSEDHKACVQKLFNTKSKRKFQRSNLEL